MQDIVRFYDKMGLPICEMALQATRSWVLNSYGQTNLLIPYGEEKLEEDIIQFGNYVTIEGSDDRIPMWSGFIDTPRIWRAGGVDVKVYSIESFLKYRRGPQNLTLKGTSGDIFKQIIDYANKQGETRIRVGDIYLGGSNRQETINFAQLFTDIQRVANRAKNDFEFIPEFDQYGRLWWTANWKERIGEDLNILLEEGKNLELTETSLSEEGLLVNDVAGYGEGETWTSRNSVILTDEESIALYGLRQHSHEFSGVTQSTTLKNNTQKFIEKYAYPRMKFTVNVVEQDADDDIFYYIRLGNTMPIRMINVGFSGKTGADRFGATGIVEIFGMAYDSKDNKMTITCQKQDEDDEDFAE